ncbi:hypothetical protein E6C27_scaffold146G00040 [Cucumis melo var. makuwa]|uniref:Uncharacterized protein n=1 Tax=Cucumis melo var. makuwa TaxID=1194695 RepID=A0A5A7V783_CUCMM|nr:hypothetical protein E6C27_scaffold146G00040 [Cucumis melo var. makuwa]
MLNDLQALIEHEEETEELLLEDEMPMNVGVNIDEDTTNNILQHLLNEARNELYPSCSEFSSLNFLVKLMHVKVLDGWSNKSFDMLLELLRSTFSMCSTTIPSLFYEAKKKKPRDLDLGYETIHACKYNCVLYWKEFADLQHFPTCGEARDNCVETDDVLRHLADAEGWKHFDYEFPDFSSDPRNVRLGLASDGLNPFGQMSTSYSQFFQLYATLLWTINDFSAYDDLSGWSTKGYQACPICMGDRSSFGIRGRISFMGYRRYLPKNHVWSGSRLHDGKVEHKAPVVLELHESENLSDDFFSLAMGPSFDVRCYNGCIVSGLRFHTVELDSRRTTQNSGVMVIGESDASGTGNNNFYGILDEVFNWKVVQVVQNKRIWDMPEVEDVQNDHINVLEIVVSHQVDDHIEDDTLCRTDVDPIIIERPIVRHVPYDFIDDVDEHLSHASEDEL